MGDISRKVAAGEVWGNVPRETFNAMVDAAVAHRAGGPQETTGTGPPRRPAGAGATVRRIKNDTGGVRSRFDVLGIDDVLFGPDDNLAEFQNGATLVAQTYTSAPGSGQTITAAHEGRYAILLEPVPAGGIARAIVAGLTIAQLYVDQDNPQYRFAKIAGTDPVFDPPKLRPRPTGSAEILWRESGTGEKWAVLRLNGSWAGAQAYQLYGKAQADWQTFAGPEQGKVSVKRCDRSGGNVAGDAFDVHLRCPPGQHPAVYQDQVITYSLDADDRPIAVGYFDRPIGTIDMAKAGEVVRTGWTLCNGDHGSPDLTTHPYVAHANPTPTGDQEIWGSYEHSHVVSPSAMQQAAEPQQGATAVQPSHTDHVHALGDANHLPPTTRVQFIYRYK